MLATECYKDVGELGMVKDPDNLYWNHIIYFCLTMQGIGCRSRDFC